jgi:NAD-dependent deacetylase
MEYAMQIAQMAELIRESPRFYALTGAGISTESGIPDFRSPGTGVWEKVDPIKTASAQVLYSNPKLFYEAGFKRFSRYASSEPNPGHHAIARLEELGYLKGLVTQNIDGLHVKAGTKKIWEVHGHLRSCRCTGCEKGYPFDELTGQVDSGRVPPECPDCRMMLRPDVVLFGDSMSEAFFEAERVLSAGCDLLLVAGSSLVVYPVAYLPDLARRIIIVNLEPTGFDDRAAVVVREKCGKVLSDLIRALK